MTGVKVHHNFSYNNCGFFEVSSGFRNSKGTFADSEFYNNISIDSGWMALLQVNNTNLSNIKFYNNTFVQRKGSTNAGILAVIYTDTSSGMTGGALLPNTVFLTNNLYVFDEVTTFGNLLDPNFAQTTNLIIDTSKQVPGFVNIYGTTATDFDLTASSPAIDKGTLIANNTLDYLNRSIPNPGGLTDIGAFEYGSTQGSGGNSGTTGAAGGNVASAGRGGSSAVGGKAAAGVGGTSRDSSGGTVGSSGGIGGVYGGSAGVISGGGSGRAGGATDNGGGCACSIGPRHGFPSAGMLAQLIAFSVLAMRRRRARYSK
jgi:hypothetical protein